MSTYAATESRHDMFRWLGLALLGLVALVTAGLMVHTSGLLAGSIVMALCITGTPVLGVALSSVWRTARGA
jgi:hypothetical protein